MKTFISDIIPKIQQFSQKLDNLTLLTNQHWVIIDEVENVKNVFIFRTNNELLISRNGMVEKAKWEYVGKNSLLIDSKDGSYLFKHGFFDENILALKIDSKEEFAFLVNENKFDEDLNSIRNVIEFLECKYLSQKTKSKIQESINSKSIDKEFNAIVDKIEIRKIETSWTLLTGKFERYEITFEDNIKSNYMKILRNSTYTSDLKKYSKFEKECILDLYKRLK